MGGLLPAHVHLHYSSSMWISRGWDSSLNNLFTVIHVWFKAKHFHPRPLSLQPSWFVFDQSKRCFVRLDCSPTRAICCVIKLGIFSAHFFSISLCNYESSFLLADVTWIAGNLFILLPLNEDNVIAFCPWAKPWLGMGSSRGEKVLLAGVLKRQLNLRYMNSINMSILHLEKPVAHKWVSNSPT